QLVARLGARTALVVHRPIWMLTVEVAVGIHHLWLNPEPKVHPQTMDVIDQRLQAMGKLCRVHIPISQASVVVIPLAEPAIIHYKSFRPNTGSLIGKRLLPRFLDVELGRLPGVVEHRPHFVGAGFGENFRSFETMQDAGCLAHPALGVAGVKRRRGERLLCRQAIGEVEGIVSTRNPHLEVGGLLDADLPVSTPAQRSEPNVAFLLVAIVVAIECEPRVHLVAGNSTPAFEHLRSGLHRFFVELPLPAPAPRKIAQTIAWPLGKRPGSRLGALDHYWGIGAVLNGDVAAQNPSLRKYLVMQMRIQRRQNVLQSNGEGVSGDRVADVVEDDGAVPVWK